MFERVTGYAVHVGVYKSKLNKARSNKLLRVLSSNGVTQMLTANRIGNRKSDWSFFI